MSTRLGAVLARERDGLRYEPTEKRIRAERGGETVIDSRRALIVWEPGRVVPTYAVPRDDVRGEPAGADGPLSGFVTLDFGAYDAWYEEDERNIGHPKDPFHRIDILHGSRHVKVEHEGVVLAESTRPYLLFETGLPVRYYLPAEDVHTDAMERTGTRSTCAYKGHAAYWAHDGEDVAWFYPEPQREAAEIKDRIAFFNERVDITVDGERLERPETPWSRGGSE
jgi:uncharacterized protein (DUF427 family)